MKTVLEAHMLPQALSALQRCSLFEGLRIICDVALTARHLGSGFSHVGSCIVSSCTSLVLTEDVVSRRLGPLTALLQLGETTTG